MSRFGLFPFVDLENDLVGVGRPGRSRLCRRGPRYSDDGAARVGNSNLLRHAYNVVNDLTIGHAATVDPLPLGAALQARLREIEAGEAT